MDIHLLMKYILILFFTIIFGNCASGFDARKKIISTNQVAIYTVPRKHISQFNLVSSDFKHPTPISKAKLTDIFGNLTYKESTQFGDYEDYLFNLNDLEEMNESLSVVLENLKPEHSILGIVQFQDYKSVISDSKRSTFLLWIDDSGLNLAFNEIKTTLPREISRNFFEWTAIQQFQLIKTQYSSQSIKDSDFFEFKKVKGFPRRNWLVFQLADLEKYKLRPRDLNINYKPSTDQ